MGVMEHVNLVKIKPGSLSLCNSKQSALRVSNGKPINTP